MVAIVDDDKQVRDSLHHLMESAGFRSLEFASAEEFLNSGEREHTACLITDIRMPGMSGLETPNKAKTGALQNSRNLHYCAT